MSGNCESFKELLFTKQLGDANEKTRAKAVQKLKKFIDFKSSKEGFTYEDLIKIWKGLYYCMYMSDKPLIQEDLAEEISNLIHIFATNSQKLLFFKVSLDTIAREWNGIDKYRYDKFLMLVTRVLRQTLIFLCKNSWSIEAVKEFSEILESHLVCPSDDKNVKPLELKMHVTDVIMEELAKVGKEKLPDTVLITVISPYIKVLALSNNKTYVLKVLNRILHALIKQSKLGLENEEDIASNEVLALPRNAKKRLNDTEMESEEDVEEKDEDFVFDPRAGGVNVFLPLLRPDYNRIGSVIESISHDPQVTRMKRKNLMFHAKQFRTLSKGIYPFKFPEIKQEPKQKYVCKQALKSLTEFDEKVSKKRKILERDETLKAKDFLIEEDNSEIEQKNTSLKSNANISKRKAANIKRNHLLRKRNKIKRKKLHSNQKKQKTMQKLLKQEKGQKLPKRKQRK